MRIVFMGTPEIAVDSLKKLIDDGHDVCAVVTQPDRPKGRGKKLAMSPVKELALEKGIDVLQPEKASSEEFVEKIRGLEPDLIVVIAFGQILKKDLLDIPKIGCINVHVSILPKYRGAAPINWVLINGEEKTGVTIMFMDEGLDTGDIITCKEFPLDIDMTAGDLHDLMMVEGAELLGKTVKDLESGNYTRTAQNHEEYSYAPMMDRDLGHIDFSRTAREVHNLVRGTIPWPGAWSMSDMGKIKIWKTRLTGKKTDKETGTIVSQTKEGLEIACKDETILVLELQVPNKKRMPFSEFIKGNRLESSYKFN